MFQCAKFKVSQIFLVHSLTSITVNSLRFNTVFCHLAHQLCRAYQAAKQLKIRSRFYRGRLSLVLILKDSWAAGALTFKPPVSIKVLCNYLKIINIPVCAVERYLLATE